MAGTENVVDAKFLLTAAISPATFILSVGKILALCYKIPTASVEMFSF